MGVDFSKEAARPPLSIACVAAVSKIDAEQFVAFRSVLRPSRALSRHRSCKGIFVEPAANHGDASHLDQPAHAAWRVYDLPVASFEHALDVSGIAPDDRVVLERMFTLMDGSGDEIVHSLELLIAMALLVKGSFSTKLTHAVTCMLADLHDKPLTTTRLVFLVSTMTTVANYFGDPLLPVPVLEEIAADVFEEHCCCAGDLDPLDESNEAVVALLVQALVKNPLVQEYVSHDALQHQHSPQ